ncbi:MAG: DNA-methyltransferase [Bacteroidales bacterium]
MRENKIIEVNGENYKVIEISISKPLSIKELSIINELHKIFPDTDFFFKTGNDRIDFYLRELDLSYFNKKVEEITQRYGIYIKESIFTEIMNRILAIRSYGIKSGKRLYVDYYKERKVKGRMQKIIERGMFFYAREHNFSKKNNEFPFEFTNKIICGDSEEVLKRLPDNCVDLIFTSPPYNFGLEYENHQDGINWNRYFDKLFCVFKECTRVLKYGGRIVVNIQPLFSDYIPIHHIISNFFMNNKLIWKGEILWEKHNYNCKYTAWGSWKSPSNPYLKYSWEFLEVFCKGDLKHYGSSKKTDLTTDEFKKWVYSKWDIAPERDMKKWGHPAMFPEELCKRVIKLFSFENDVVLDPFNGVGSTTKVAKELNRRFCGIDISEEYCKKAEERLKLPVLQPKESVREKRKNNTAFKNKNLTLFQFGNDDKS